MSYSLGSGQTLTLTASSALSANDVVQVGGLIGVVVDDAASGDAYALSLSGVFPIAKDSSTFAVGEPAFWSGSAATSGPGRYLGVCVEAAVTGATTVKVRLDGAANGPDVFKMSGAGTPLAPNATDATEHAETVTIPANFFASGDEVRYTVNVQSVGLNGTDAVTLALTAGGLTLCTTDSATPTVNEQIRLTGSFRIPTAGASGTVYGRGEGIGDTHEATTALNGSTLDTTAAIEFAVVATWAAAHADNSTAVRELLIERL